MADDPIKRIGEQIQPIGGAIDEMLAELAGQRLSFCLIVLSPVDGKPGEGEAKFISNLSSSADLAEILQDLVNRLRQ